MGLEQGGQAGGGFNSLLEILVLQPGIEAGEMEEGRWRRGASKRREGGHIVVTKADREKMSGVAGLCD